MTLTPGAQQRQVPAMRVPLRGGMTAGNAVWGDGCDCGGVPGSAPGCGAVFVEHRLKIPQVAESAYIAPTAVLAGDVTVGPHSRVLFGAVITAEGGPVQIGSNCVIMKNAVIRVCRARKPASVTTR
jgi:acetyltransferase-like isoleucine patch superfamily enzyme